MKDKSIKVAERKALFIRSLVYLSAGITVFILFAIIVYILMKGIPHIKPEMFQLKYNSINLSLMPAMINTVVMTGLTLLFAIPAGVFTAIYLVEYAKKENFFVRMINVTTETLAGIPSIVYGLFGYLFFVTKLKFSYSLISGALTLAIMILPLIIRTSQEALMSVPDMYREGSFGLGAGKLRTVFRIVLPSAMPGILSGIILGIGRIVGETAALIYTAGTVAQYYDSFLTSGRTLAIHLYSLWVEGLQTDSSYATAVILLVAVMIINALATFVASRIKKGNKEE
ncbi:MAG: phosphate ABC transporter permease PstA [Clostridia bacterium]|nr:phosphate ABC transporter permease PstA [Clostridia bacterium]